MIQTKLKKYEIVGEYRHIQILEELYEIEDNQVIDHQPSHRRVIAPGDDVSAETAEIQALCSALHTPAVVEAYLAFLDSQERQ